MGFRTMADGTIAFGDNNILDLYNNVIMNQMSIERNAKFKTGSIVEVIASVNELTQFFMSSGETPMGAKNHAFIILANKTGVIDGAVKCTEGMFYNISFETEPCGFLPESFLRGV